MRTHTHVRSGVSSVGILVAIVLAALLVVGVTQFGRAVIATNEALTVRSLKRIGRACRFYFMMHGRYPENLTVLAPGSKGPIAGYLVAELATEPLIRQGYFFTYTRSQNGKFFTVLATPKDYGVTGTRHFYLGKDFVIHATTQDEDAYVHHPVVAQVP